MSDSPLIHVVDDDESLRTALLRLLTASGYRARGYASAGDFLLYPQEDCPGCLLLDLNMPGGPSGLELQTGLQSRGVHLPVIFFTGYGDMTTSVRALKAGAVDFLAKPVERKVLLDALQHALALDLVWRNNREQATDLRARFSSLSLREREVFDLVLEGQLNKQIADQLRVCERTVQTVRAQLMLKLGAESVAELGRLAERLKQLSEA